MNLHFDTRGENDFAFYINGDLQFDTRDEAIYHESLALPALSLAARRKTALPSPDLRVLICGGGDGLALRECLRFPNVSQVDLVDYSAEVVQEGRTRFAAINARAFDDPRAQVHIADAWQFLSAVGQEVAPSLYDVVICDFTVPQREEDTRIFSREWYALSRSALAPHGLLAINAVSPQTTPEAFWCLRNTLRAAHLAPLPYRVCIPSFRAQGYGVWAFMLAGANLRREELRDLRCPITTRQAALSELWRGTHFSRDERRKAKRIPIHTLDAPVLMPLLLNPGTASLSVALPEGTDAAREAANAPYDLNALLRAIPISHPYHTRAMIETLAAQVVGTVRHLDIQRLVEALIQRAQSLPPALCAELSRLKAFLQGRFPRLEMFGTWGRKLFVTLVILMTLANSIAPDNAFAKGGAGGSHSSFGHASMSRGYGHYSNSGIAHTSGSFGAQSGAGSTGGASRGSSFGGQRGYSNTNRASSGSFGGKPGYGSSFGSGGRSASGSFSPAPAIHSSGFRRSYRSGQPVDIEGVAYTPHYYTYYPRYRSYPYNSGSVSDTGAAPQHKAVFVADDDLLVLDNGDVIITLSDAAYLLISGSSLSLMSQQQAAPLRDLYPDPDFFQNVIERLQERQAQVASDIPTRRDWLAWVGWTSALSHTVAEDKMELSNLEDLNRRLLAALDQIKVPSVGSSPIAPPESTPIELFADCVLLPSGKVALFGVDDVWMTTDGKQIAQTGHAPSNSPPELTKTIQSVLAKLEKEFTGDIASDENDLQQLASDKSSLESDLNEYKQILAQNGDPNYEVDYGTDEISVSAAIDKTQAELTQNAADTTQTQADIEKLTGDLARVHAAIQQFGK